MKFFQFDLHIYCIILKNFWHDQFYRWRIQKAAELTNRLRLPGLNCAYRYGMTVVKSAATNFDGGVKLTHASWNGKWELTKRREDWTSSDPHRLWHWAAQPCYQIPRENDGLLLEMLSGRSTTSARFRIFWIKIIPILKRKFEKMLDVEPDCHVQMSCHIWTW